MRPGSGFHEVELHEDVPFRWMERAAAFELAPGPNPRFVELEVCGIAEDIEQSLVVTAGPERRVFPLIAGSNTVSVAVPGDATALRLETDRALPAEQRPGDAHELALRVREAKPHDDAARHAGACERHDAGVSAARAIASSLLGEYRRSGRSLRLLEGFHELETDEGQAFRWMARRGRLGLPPSPRPRFLELQVRPHSRDLSQHLTARVEGAAPCRHPLVDGWSTVSFALPPGCEHVSLEADGLARRRPGDARELSVQVRWPLLHEDERRHEHVGRQHANRVLNQRELLPFEELVRVSGRVAELCRRLGVDLSDQMDFGGSMAAEFGPLFEQGRREGAAAPLRAVPAAAPGRNVRLGWGVEEEGVQPATAAHDPASGETGPGAAPPLPLCTEPWTSQYVLRRGTLPCCYGGPALAPMAGFKDAWNAPLVQEIRRELAAGRFHRYCFDSPDCPIVRKAAEGRSLPASQAALLGARRGLSRLRRYGGAVLAPLRKRARRA